MGKTLKNLVLAMLNATLILLALCLFLGWKLSVTTGKIVDDFTDSLHIVRPLQQDVAQTRQEVQALRADLADLAGTVSGIPPATLARIERRLDQINTRMAGVQDNISSLRETPQRLLDQSLQDGTDKFFAGLADWRACRAQNEPGQSDG